MADSKCRILYVDDHEDSAEMFRLLLDSPEYEVEIAHTIAGALQRARIESFDLYVLDKRLPDGSGTELCRQLSVISPGVPCIFYTGDAYEIQRHEAMAAGASAYIPKPEIEKLISTVERLLADRECAAAM